MIPFSGCHGFSNRPEVIELKALNILLWSSLVFLLGAGSVMAVVGFEELNHCVPVLTVTCDIGNPSIFTRVICLVEFQLNETLTELYCRTYDFIIEPLSALIVLYVAVTGILFALGMIEMSTKEVMVRILTLVGVWFFATDAQYTLGLGYRLFIEGMREGMMIVAGMPETPLGAASDCDWHTDTPYFAFDCVAITLFGLENGLINSQAFDQILKGLVLLFIPGGSILAPLLLGASFFIIIVFMRFTMSYLMAVVGLTFLFMVAPIFISFFLFMTTRPIFTNWVQNLFSFALQPMLLFGALILTEGHMTEAGRFYEAEVAPHIFIQNDAYSGVSGMSGTGSDAPGSFMLAMDMWKICRLDTVAFDADSPAICPPGCNGDPNGWGGAWTATGLPSCGGVVPDYNANVEPLGMFDFPPWFAELLFHLVALALLAYAMNIFLRFVPEICKQLAGSTIAPRLGAGPSRSLRQFGTAGGGAFEAPGFNQLHQATGAFISGAANEKNPWQKPVAAWNAASALVKGR